MPLSEVFNESETGCSDNSCSGTCLFAQCINKRGNADSEIYSDSGATAVLVFSMARLVVSAMHDGNEQVIKDAKMVAGKTSHLHWMPENAGQFANLILCTNLVSVCPAFGNIEEMLTAGFA